MSGRVNWTLCVICQKKTSEELRCPLINPLDVYNAFVKNMEEFKKLDCLPVDIDLKEDGHALMENHAKWHKQCHQKFNNAKLERAKLKRQREEKTFDDLQCPPKRRSTERNKKSERSKVMCIFCEISSEPLHEFTTFNASKSISQMATEMGDKDLLVKLSGGDLVAIEAKYHFKCLSNYRNRYRAYLRAGTSSSSLADSRAKAQAFAEMVADIESMIEEGNHILKLTDLHAIYEERLQKLGLDTSINKTRLKNDIIDHFRDSGIQEQTDGINTLLVFPKGIIITNYNIAKTLPFRCRYESDVAEC